jgi:hypothetical protein
MPASFSPGRRTFMAGGLAAVGAATMASPSVKAQTSAPTSRHRIDVHHHVAPPKWLAEVVGRDLLQPATRDWSAEKSIEDMDKGDVAAAVVSVTNPGLWFGDVNQSKRLARASNEMMAKLVQDRPARFGMFAAMPLPDADATLREIEYALDTLKSDGIGLFTSYQNVWLGDRAFDPVMEELNRRGALVFVHPTAAACCMNLIPDAHPGVMEYGTDTTRAIWASCSAARRFAIRKFGLFGRMRAAPRHSWPGASKPRYAVSRTAPDAFRMGRSARCGSSTMTLRAPPIPAPWPR